MAVVAKATCRVAGYVQMLKAGQLYDENDPVVKARPELFESPEDYQRRKQRPQSTADLGERSMLNHRPVETARSAPGDVQAVEFPCPAKDSTGCDRTFSSIQGAKTHAGQAHK